MLLFSSAGVSGQQVAKVTGPPLLNYKDLVQLYEEDNPPEDLGRRLTELLNTPFVDNTATSHGVKPLKAIAPGFGKSLRVAMWNIERGLEFESIKAAFTHDEKFLRQTARNNGVEAKILEKALSQSEMLKQADVVVLNEVDWGLKRTVYRNVVKELAAALRMNYAYAVEFVEVDPITLGIETLEGETAPDKQELIKHMAVDKSRTLGLHGSAILSRFPLQNVRVHRFANQGHDWYTTEKKDPSKLEKGKRKGAGYVFDDKIMREVRRGGRMAILADIEDAEFPGGVVTIVATHIESKTKPSNRVKQLQELLDLVKDCDHPLVLAGDMNTTGSDATPTSFQREVKQRMGSGKFWVTKGVKYATGVGLVYDVTLGTVKTHRAWTDPTVKNVRFVSENSEAEFFSTLKSFRFADGNALDFRGTKERSVGGRERTLANSNQRDSKGFVSTFELTGRITIPMKLDWIFVKPPKLTEPEDKTAPYLFAPAFGRTLKTLNYLHKDRMADHSPVIVDLPLQ